MEWAVFVVFAVCALGGAAGVVLARKPVHAALSLVLTLFSVAVFFVLQGAHFLAAVQVIVYAGAIVILFLFVIMLLGIDKEDLLDEPLPVQRPLAVAVGVALFAGLLLVAKILVPTGAAGERGSATQGDVSNVERLARSLFTDFLWPFEITSALLVIAVVGGIVLARRSGPGRLLTEDERVGGGSDEGPEAALERRHDPRVRSAAEEAT
ncbi:MAG TPA: NADH-quinone oxidoreductase subunit J [Acidimicrobiia bacterium]|nr:NADH-quinone oxidoreductase subunit J [Acidimicrobiia bacterium]